MSDFRTYVTQTGFGLERDAKFNNTQVDLAVLVIGDGVLSDSNSPAEQIDLVNQIRSYAITIEKDDMDANVWIARAEIPASDGGFFIKEAGIKTTNGELYSYARQAGDYKPQLEEGQGKSYTIRLKFVPANADSIQIKIDPSVQFVTPTDLENAVKGHLDTEDPHSQYQTKALAGSQAATEKVYMDGLQNSKKLFDVSGDENDIVLTSKAGTTKITGLNDYDEFSFVVSATNTTSSVSVKIDSLAVLYIVNIVAENQLFIGSLVSLKYIGGAFFVVSAVNPRTGNAIARVGDALSGTTSILMPGEVAFNGGEKSREGSFLWLKALVGGQVVDQSIKDSDYEKYAGLYGSGDGVTTFTMPEHRGEHYRNWDNGRGVDPDRKLGQYKKGSLVGFDTGYDGLWNVSTTDLVDSDALDGLGFDVIDVSKYPNGRLTAGDIAVQSLLPGSFGNQGGAGVARVRGISVFAKTVE